MEREVRQSDDGGTEEGREEEEEADKVSILIADSPGPCHPT